MGLIIISYKHPQESIGLTFIGNDLIVSDYIKNKEPYLYRGIKL